MKHDRTLYSVPASHVIRMSQLRKAVAYIRVSTERQADVGMSLNDQRAAIAEHAATNGLDVIQIYEEHSSASKGTLADRPKLCEALEYCGKVDAVLIVAKPNRLSRSRAVLEEIFAHDVPVHVAGRGKLSRVILRQEVRVAEAEAHENSARQTEAHKEKKTKHGGRKQPCNISMDARHQGSDANQARRDRNTRAIARHWFETPGFEKLTWDKRAEALSVAGILNEKSKLERKPWSPDALRKLWSRVMNELTALRTPVVANVAGPVASSSTTAISLPASLGVVPPLFLNVSEARLLTTAERERLQKIMSVHRLSQSVVMDKLGFDRLDASLWSAMSCPSRVRPEILKALQEFAATWPV